MDLAACPFCGNATHFSAHKTMGPSWCVRCDDCFAIGPDCDSEADARTAWNMRTPPDELAARREARELAGLPAVSVDTSDGGVSMDFDLGGDPKKPR